MVVFPSSLKHSGTKNCLLCLCLTAPTFSMDIFLPHSLRFLMAIPVWLLLALVTSSEVCLTDRQGENGLLCHSCDNFWTSCSNSFMLSSAIFTGGVRITKASLFGQILGAFLLFHCIYGIGTVLSFN